MEWFIRQDTQILRKIIQQGCASFSLRGILRSRIDHDLLQRIQRPLAGGVKAADRIHLISPQLDPPGIVLCQGIHIQDAAADSKLARHIDLACHFVSQIHHPVPQLIQIHGIPLPDSHPSAGDILQG